MTHLSGGAISGIAFGTALFVLVGASLALWWRRVHRDHFSNDPNAWGGSWGVKAMEQAQARMDEQRKEELRLDMQRQRTLDEQRSTELRGMSSGKDLERGDRTTPAETVRTGHDAADTTRATQN
ncbi:hypothetical protein H2198_003621 [Neophaeococcomyces mojaviensis]|uniref:Uncharacterized protein n=1 Tax=Neophaeococcomyces mojaviensis TaxID=3383035 RepID=A0ACC3ABC0_9EURO|nr:hypothetical protein H2198_003621 [Knufia sp. JES_112]